MSAHQWSRTRLEDVCFRVTDGTHQSPRFEASGIPFLVISNVVSGEIDWSGVSKWVSEETYQTNTERCRPARGDILYTAVGSFGVAVPVETDRPFMFQRHIAHIKPDPSRVHTRYLAYLLNSPVMRATADRVAKGVAQRTVTLTDLKAFEIPLLPLPEQRRIASILDKADAIRRKRKEAIALTEELLRSAFLEMFGDPVTNPKGWAVRPLGEVIEKLEAGWSANGDARPRLSEEYGVLKVSAVTSGFFRSEEHKAVAADAVDRELVTPRAGDLLFSRANTRELVAATCIVESDEPRLFLPDKIWRVVPRDRIATTPYLRFLLAHDRFRGELTKTATGTSGSMLNVSMDKLRTLRAPIPPFAAQQRFSVLVWSSLRSKVRHMRAQRGAEDLFASLVHRAFSGALSA